MDGLLAILLRQNRVIRGGLKFARELAQLYISGSRTSAARAVKAQVMDFLDRTKKHYSLTENNAERTIYGWLADIPFEGKRGPRKQNVKG